MYNESEIVNLALSYYHLKLVDRDIFPDFSECVRKAFYCYKPELFPPDEYADTVESLTVDAAEKDVIDGLFANLDCVIGAATLLKGEERSERARHLAIMITEAEKLRAWAKVCFSDRQVDNG